MEHGVGDEIAEAKVLATSELAVGGHIIRCEPRVHTCLHHHLLRTAPAELLGEPEGDPDEFVCSAHGQQRDVFAGALRQGLANGQGQKVAVDRGAVDNAHIAHIRAGSDRGADALDQRIGNLPLDAVLVVPPLDLLLEFRRDG